MYRFRVPVTEFHAIKEFGREHGFNGSVSFEGPGATHGIVECESSVDAINVSLFHYGECLPERVSDESDASRI